VSAKAPTDIEKRFAERRDRIFKVMREIGSETEADFANSMEQKMAEFEQMADDSLRANDPLNAIIYQSIADHIYFYTYRNIIEKGMLKQYKQQHDQYRKSLRS
jgi:hypothetical protein